MRGSRGRLEGLDAAQLHEAHELAEGADTLGGEGAAASFVTCFSEPCLL